MYQARYYKTDGSKGSEVSLPTALFDGVVNESVLHQVVKAYLANQRAGTGSAKSRGQVRGGSRKPWRQKGTGRARAGTTRAAHWAGGGVAFPPKPHSWRQKVPKKVRALARRSAFNDRAESGRVVVIEGFQAEAPKTKWLMGLLAAMETEGKVLLLTDGVKENVHLSGRNLPDVQVLPFGSESPYDVVWSGTVVIEEAALRTVPKEKASSKSGGRRPVDRDAIATEAAERAARKKARNSRPDSTRRIKGDDIDLSAPLLEKEARAPRAQKAAPTKKVKKAKAQPPAKAPKAEATTEAPAEKLTAETPPAEVEKPEAEKSEPKAEATPKASGFDAASVELPKVADLAGFLAGIDNADDVKTLSERDKRKTAAPLYAARIEEIGG